MTDSTNLHSPVTDEIRAAVESKSKLFISGPFGSGKTTLALERIRWLLRQERTRGDDILVLVPQRTLAQPYHDALRGPDAPPGPPVRVTTLAGLARNALELYWPLVAADAGFADARKEPTFLNLETAQYHMARFVDAAIAQADFDGIRIERSRIISQVLDNLNKAALHGLSIGETYERLELAVPAGETRTARLNALRAAQRISQQFRQLCQQETLIDFSLMIDLFSTRVLTNDWSRTHLFRSQRHLIADNVEEGNVSAHRLITGWLPHLDSALILSDDDAGYRIFLGADPQGVPQLAAACAQRFHLPQSYTLSPALRQLTHRINVAILGPQRAAQQVEAANPFDDKNEGGQAGESQHDDMALSPPIAVAPTVGMEKRESALIVPNVGFRFYPQMIEWVVNEVHRLVTDEGVSPGEIVVLAPYVSDALRFSLQTGLAVKGIESTTHRPSRALHDEPATRALLTLAALGHPHWGIRPAPADVTMMLDLVIEGLDPVRAHLLSRIVYPPRSGRIDLGNFGELVPEMQQRITYIVGERYDRLREWLYVYRSSADLVPLDQFFARLFGEVLSQQGYGFHQDYDAARVANQLVESARNFRWALEDVSNAELGLQKGELSTSGQRQGEFVFELGREYVRLVESGALGALYVPGWRIAENAVFLAPAYTYLMRNRAVAVQFWIDIGSGGWWERLYQPLTHPYVLSQRWPASQPWSDYDEFTTRQETMRRLLLGLVRRTRTRIYLGMSDYSESGFEQRGPLLNLINRLLAQGGDR